MLFVANNLVVGRGVWLPAAPLPDITICHEALPLEEIEPELLAFLPGKQPGKGTLTRTWQSHVHC